MGIGIREKIVKGGVKVVGVGMGVRGAELKLPEKLCLIKTCS